MSAIQGVSEIFDPEQWDAVPGFDDLTDLTYHRARAHGTVRIAFDRPDVLNAFRPHTVDELLRVLEHARTSSDVGCVLLTGNGPSGKHGKWAFCSGGDQRIRGDDGYVDSKGVGRLNVLDLQVQIRRLPKPVVAMVAGYAIGGGHVLHVLCDLSIAAEHARFGQAGPRVGSFDAGFGSAYLARVIGEKRARQMWFLLDRIDAPTALSWGLVNAVVPAGELLETALAWGRKIAGYSPTALRFLKHSFNADSDHLSGLSHVAFDGLEVFSHTDEAAEGARAFAEKRPPDFGQYR